MSDLKALRDRLRAATGSDPLLDYDITRALWPLKILQAPPTTDREYYAPITASVDAALALCERKLPGAWFRIDRAVTRPEATRWRVELADSHEWSWAPTAPLGILIALLEAMIGKETG